MALAIGAAVLVLLAIWWRMGAAGGQRERRWVALGGSFTTAPGRPSWVSAVRLPGRPVEAIDLTAPGATLVDVLSAQLGPALAARPAVAVIWVGPDDLLNGRPLPALLADLGHVIDRCREEGVAVIVVGMPRVGWPQGLRGRRPERVMATVHGEWRTGIADVARHGGAELLPPERGDDAPPALVRDGRWTLLTDPARNAVADRLADAITTAMRRGVAVDALLDGHDGPGDPVVRRRLGLPPLR
jgi:hypothetical protein